MCIERLRVICDASVLSDLYKQGLMEKFLSLPWEFNVMDFSLDQLGDVGKAILRMGKGKINVISFSGNQLEDELDCRALCWGESITFMDYLIWSYSHSKKCTILSTDKFLNKELEAEGLSFIKDEIFKYHI